MKFLTILSHFAIITYAIDPASLHGMLPDRFALDLVPVDGEKKALLSVVTFVGENFRLAALPFPKFTLRQTNYRVYITDTQTGAKAVWFLGSVVDSLVRLVPYCVWKLPWYKGTFVFDCRHDPGSNVYTKYHVRTESGWANAEVTCSQPADFEPETSGFSSLDKAIDFLTQRFNGFYQRHDTKLASVNVRHERLSLKPALCQYARFELLDRMNLVPENKQLQPLLILLQERNEFIVYLPPKKLIP